MPEIREIYVPEREVQNLKIMDGDVVWKQQEIFLEEFPQLKENEGKGNYTVSFAPIFGENVFYSFNRTRTRCCARSSVKSASTGRCLWRSTGTR